MLVHKSTHHFDLVNFWLNAQPKTVFAFGERNFYGIENAEKRGVKEFYYRSHGSASAKNDSFAIDLESNKKLVITSYSIHYTKLYDAKLRDSMRRELKLLHNRLGSTIIYVTHDQIEALTS